MKELKQLKDKRLGSWCCDSTEEEVIEKLKNGINLSCHGEVLIKLMIQ